MTIMDIVMMRFIDLKKMVGYNKGKISEGIVRYAKVAEGYSISCAIAGCGYLGVLLG